MFIVVISIPVNVPDNTIEKELIEIVVSLLVYVVSTSIANGLVINKVSPIAVYTKVLSKVSTTFTISIFFFEKEAMLESFGVKEYPAVV